jgi:hypothetical protein
MTKYVTPAVLFHRATKPAPKEPDTPQPTPRKDEPAPVPPKGRAVQAPTAQKPS